MDSRWTGFILYSFDSYYNIQLSSRQFQTLLGRSLVYYCCAHVRTTNEKGTTCKLLMHLSDPLKAKQPRTATATSAKQ